MSGTFENPHKGRPLTGHGFSSDRFNNLVRNKAARQVGLLWLVLTALLVLFAWVPARIMGVAASPPSVRSRTR